MTLVGCSATPGQLLEEDPVQSVVKVVVAEADLSACPRHIQLVTDQGKWLAWASCQCF